MLILSSNEKLCKLCHYFSQHAKTHQSHENASCRPFSPSHTVLRICLCLWLSMLYLSFCRPQKNAEGKLGLGPQSLLPPPSPPAAGRSRTHRSDNDRSRRGATPPPRTGTAGTASRSYRGRGGGGGGIELRTASSKGNLDTERLVTTNRHQATVLTEVNVAKHGGGSGGSRFGGGLAEGGIAAGGGAASVPWRREVGAKGRAKRYMRGRHGGRAARQARLNNAMRNLLHAL